eukprot:COSAG02_NODE_2101_length_9808_cov_3.575658_10_plen_130_part_00
MSLGALADGFAVKVKGDTFKRSGIPNSRFEILQQGFVPDAHGGGHCEMQVSEPVMLSTWSASNYCQGPGDYSLFLTVSPDFASNLFCETVASKVRGPITSLEPAPAPDSDEELTEDNSPGEIFDTGFVM